MNNIRHIGIYVHDLEKMKDFYCSTFSMTVQVHDIEKGEYIDGVLGLQNCEIELYKLASADGSMLELLHKAVSNENQSDKGKYVYDIGRMHIAFTVKDVKNLYHKMKDEQGVSFISCPCDAPGGKARVCFCQDVEGNYLELVEELE